MIWGNVQDLTSYAFLEEPVLRCFQYARQNKLEEFTKGVHPIDGDALFVNIAEYTTAPAERRIWEAHREYLDLHLMLRGEERLHVGILSRMEQGVYVPADDFVPLEGKAGGEVGLAPGDFLLCFPSDGHKTGVWNGRPETIKKAIFKISLKDS